MESLAAYAGVWPPLPLSMNENASPKALPRDAKNEIASNP